MEDLANGIAVLVQAIATRTTVAIAWKYANDTNRLAKIAKEQIKNSEQELKVMREQVNASRENLLLEYNPNLLLLPLDCFVDDVQFQLVNLGRHPVYIHSITSNILGDDLIFPYRREVAATSATGYKRNPNRIIDSGSSAEISLLPSVDLTKQYKTNVKILFRYGSTAGVHHPLEFQIEYTNGKLSIHNLEFSNPEVFPVLPYPSI